MELPCNFNHCLLCAVYRVCRDIRITTAVLILALTGSFRGALTARHREASVKRIRIEP